MTQGGTAPHGGITYRDLWKRLAPIYGEREAMAVTDYALDMAFHLSRTDAVCGKLDGLSPGDVEELWRIFSLLEDSVPVQYAVGVAEFASRRFTVRPGVLIPRPETEGLCDLARRACEGFQGPAILDIGTGSGCIAITLALDIPGSRVHAWDISAEALEVARENDARLGSGVAFFQRDILGVQAGGERWDVIVSNPPYVMESERQAMAGNVLGHEPHLALFVPDDDPLSLYGAMADYASRTLTPAGRFLLEINPLLAGEFPAFMCGHGFPDVEILEDMFGRKRFAACSLGDSPQAQATEAAAYSRLSALCASSERCSGEIMGKLGKMPLSDEARQRVMQRLLDGGFIDDERFCRSFVRDKIHLNKWGRRKVEQALEAKGVDRRVYAPVLDGVDDREYLDVLVPLVKARMKGMRAMSGYEMRGRLMRFAAGRGFTMDLIRKCLDEVGDPGAVDDD